MSALAETVTQYALDSSVPLKGNMHKKDLETCICRIIEDALQDPKSFSGFSGNIDHYPNISALDTDMLAEIIEGLYAGTQQQTEFNTHMWEQGVAPASLIAADFDQSQFNLFFGNGVHHRNDMLIRAIPGHAQSGHCLFRGVGKYPNTMSVDVVNALQGRKKLKVGSFQSFSERSQEEINEILYSMENFFQFWTKRPMQKLMDRKKNPLSKLEFLRKDQYTCNMIEGLRGFYFGGHFDNYDIVRSGARDKYGFEIGGGSTYACDINVLKKYNISLKELAHAEYGIPFLNCMEPEKRVELFKRIGLIVDSPEIDLDDIDPVELNWNSILARGINPRDHPDKDIRKVYIRTAKGSGVADDVAVVLGAFLPQTFTKPSHTGNPADPMSRFMYAFLADRIDTLEKDSSVIIPGGQDEMAARYINHKFRHLCRDYSFRKAFNIREGLHDLVSLPAVMDFTIASAIRDLHIHSSQRYFLMRKSNGNNGNPRSTCALNEYIRAVYTNAHSRGIKATPLPRMLNYSDPNINIGFTAIPLADVLRTIHERLNLVNEPYRREKNLREFYSA